MNEEHKYYPILDNYIKLYMTPFGKIKLSIIPENISLPVYNYFKTQEKMPTFDQFFKACVHQCETHQIDLKPYFEKFYALCKKHNINPNSTAVTFIPQVPEDQDVDVEEEFWKIEASKISPAGIASAFTNGYLPNPFRNKILALNKHKHPKLLSLYIKVHEDSDTKVKDYDSHKNYLTELSVTFKK